MNPIDRFLPEGDETETLRTASNSMRDLLQGILKTITRLPWLHTDAGGVFLLDPVKRHLELVTHVNFSPKIQGACETVAFGHCLCGRVAESGKLLHAGCVDHRHETRYEGMADHGHYVVPIRDGQEILGVFTLYVEAGHRYRDDEAEALLDFATAMATIIRTSGLRQDKALADLILEHSNHGIMVADRERRILWVNPSFEQVTGYRLDEVRGKTPAILSSGRHDTGFYREMWLTINREGRWQGEIWNRRKNGEIYPEFLNIVALKDENGQVQRYAGLFVDLTEIRRAEERIHRLAYFDTLTGLPNRVRFMDELGGLLTRARTAERVQRLIVLLIDLDHFNEINNALGREAGDALLRETAHRLAKALDGCLLSRAERDQFLAAVAVPDDGTDLAAFSSGLVGRIRAALEPAFLLYGQELALQATIGLVAWDGDERDTEEELLSRANLALLDAKRRNRGGEAVFDEVLGREAEYDHHIVLNIRHVVERRELHLVYQPQVDSEERLVGAEALLRWQSPDRGLIPPDRFIPHAEKRGVIGVIGHWVFEQALEQLTRWQGDGIFAPETFKLSVNLSPAQLIGQDVAESFARICEERGIAPSSLVIEITETAIMQASDVIRGKIEELSAAGFRIAIDDFGTGHSSLSRLHAFPIDTFKIDRSFISPIESGGKHLAIVKSMIAMAHELGQTVVAEGVENEHQFAILRNLGCEYYQGYWFARPMAAHDLEHFHGSRKSPVSGIIVK